MDELRVARTMRGTPASAGTHCGRALRVECPADLDAVRQGDVVLVREARPEYAAGLARAGALIAPGGVLGNLAIVARELGVPAILLSAEATACIHSGDEVLVDGDLGTVQMLAVSLLVD